MGQYHKTVAFPIHDERGVLDPEAKPFTVDPHALGSGLKLVEQFYCWTPDNFDQRIASLYAQAWALMLTNLPGRYRVITVGDYADHEMLPPFYDGRFTTEQMYSASMGDVPGIENRTEFAKQMLMESLGYRYVDNGMRWADVDPDIERLKMAARRLGDRTNGDRQVLCAPEAGEYLDPVALGSPPDAEGACVIGAVWPIALSLTAISDGMGGGDFCWQPPGRWAYNHLHFTTLSNAQTHHGWHDITNDLGNHIEVLYMLTGR